MWFEGTGVDDDADNPDGEAMLSAADWRIGKRTVTVKSNKALITLKFWCSISIPVWVIRQLWDSMTT